MQAAVGFKQLRARRSQRPQLVICEYVHAATLDARCEAPTGIGYSQAKVGYRPCVIRTI